MAIKIKYDPKEVLYFGVENKSELVIRKDLADLTAISHLEPFYIRRDFHHEAQNNYRNGYIPFYYYKIIGRSGERTSINIGNFSIEEIEPEVNYYGRFDYRNIKVFEKTEGKYYNYKSKTTGEAFILADLLFLVDKLKFIPNWSILMDYLAIPALKAKINRLEEELTTLKNSMPS